MEDVPVYLNMNESPYTQRGHHASLSADEAAIRRRGKRRIPASFSPEREDDRGPVSASPVTIRAVSPPRRDMLVARKKLFSDGDSPACVAASPAKKKKTTMELSFNHNNNDPKSDTPKKMAALSKEQLVKLVNDISLVPSLLQKVTPMVPAEPDITGKLANLEKHRINVYKAMPKSRLTNRHDSISYNRVYLHLNSFHKVLMDDLNSLEASEHWPTVIRYVMNAWPIMDKSPVWEDSPHNRTSVQCFKYLANVGIKALRSSEFDESVRLKLLDMMNKSSYRGQLEAQIGELKNLEREKSESSEQS